MASFYEELQNSDSISDEKENAQSRANVDKWIFRLFLFLIGVMPLIVLANVEEVISPLISNVDILASGTKGDLFTHYKALLVLIVTIITSVLLLVKIFFMNGTIRKTFLNYVLGIFVLIILISTIMSPNISIALSGLYNRSDGAISWLCYVALMFIAMNIEYPKNVIRYIMYTMIPFVFINLYIITMNFYGKDLLQNSWMQSLVSIMLPEGANISEGSTLVGTLNQWNYMSGMFGILTVMYLMGSVIEKKLVQSVLFLITSLVSIAIVLMSLSTSGFLTICVLMILIVFITFKSENKWKGITIVLIFLIGTAPIIHVLSVKEDRVWKESIGAFLKNNPYGWKPEDETSSSKNNIGIWKHAYASGKFELPVIPESSMSMGTGRLYIWEKTFESMDNRLFIGNGLDTLIYNFPHYNKEARSGLQDENTLVDKPHNMYMGIFYGTGIIGIISIIGIIVILSIRLMNFSKKNKVYDIWILGLSVYAYLVQAIFNDSLPSISAIIWILIGVLLALTFENKEIEHGRND